MSNIINKIRLSGVTYTLNGTVSSAITSGDTNPVEGGVLYDELRIPVESGLTLEWELYDGGGTINYPSGQVSKIIFENISTTESGQGYEPHNYFSFNSSDGDELGHIEIIINDGVVTVGENQNVTYSISGNNVTVEYPSIAANVGYIYASYDNYWTTIAYIESVTPLINQVSANTIAISGKQDILSAGTNITISGNVISATGGGSGNPTVELTQAEYDALVESGTVQSDTYYIITDAQAGDLTQYWTSAQTQSAINAATSGKVNTSSVVSSVTSASTDNEIPTAKAVYDATQGGTTYTAGRGIDIANDTISVSLPISAGTGVDSVLIGLSSSDNFWMPKATAKGAIAAGIGVSAMSECSFAFGYKSTTTGNNLKKNSFAHGYNSIANGSNSHAEGNDAIANGSNSHAEGKGVLTNNEAEHSQGQYNNSVSASTTFGDSGNTLFSVGNGTADNARHNAFEIRQNGDIYFNDGTSDVKLQDKFSTIETTIGDINTLLSQI